MNQDVTEYLNKVGNAARESSKTLAHSTAAQKNNALLAIAEELDKNRSVILQANQQDLTNGKNNSLDDAVLDRLALSDERINAMITGLHHIIALPEIIGAMRDMRYMPSGIQVGKMRVPLGVIGIIYESRPNVTLDAAALCLKSGNSCILRGGSEAINSNQAIASCITKALQQANLPTDCVQVANITDRKLVDLMITSSQFIDVIVPRGGNSLTALIAAKASVPVIKHLDGICHVFIDKYADFDKAIKIADNAKTQRYAPCNTMETLLIHHQIAAQILPPLTHIYHAKGVELRGCVKTQLLAAGILSATEEDWRTEYGAPILAIKIVDSLKDAINHINKYGSHHTDAIVSENYTRTQKFIVEVDSSSVMVNASTRFADGFEYGLGAEIGISTDKLHARGPVGLEGLTSEKYVVLGNGHIRV